MRRCTRLAHWTGCAQGIRNRRHLVCRILVARPVSWGEADAAHAALCIIGAYSCSSYLPRFLRALQPGRHWLLLRIRGLVVNVGLQAQGYKTISLSVH